MCYYDIPEDLWLRLEPILPTEGSPRGGRPTGDVRNFLNAVHWMLRTGSPWRALPEKYGSWKTVYSRFRRWQKRGYLTAILKLLTLQADMNHIMIDGTYVHAHKHSAGARHTSGINQALGRSRGGFTSKIHAVVDALGNLLAFTVTAGQYSEYPQASNLLMQYHNTSIPEERTIIPVPLTGISTRNVILLRRFSTRSKNIVKLQLVMTIWQKFLRPLYVWLLHLSGFDKRFADTP